MRSELPRKVWVLNDITVQLISLIKVNFTKQVTVLTKSAPASILFLTTNELQWSMMYNRAIGVSTVVLTMGNLKF